MYRFGSLASGIEAASVAWKPLGMTPAFLSEIDPFCCSLLKERHDDAPNLGNMNDITTHDLRRCGKIDVLIAGTPCQAFSVAGQRGGIADPRGQLALRAVQILEYSRPRWFVWENVPGVLSSGGGRDFGAFVGAVAQLGYGYAWRTLDAQFFGVPQRRRRVFLVGYLGDWRRAAAVLFEPDSVPRNPSPSRKKKSDTAGTITSGSGRRRGAGVNPSEIVAALTACGVGTCGADDNQDQAGHLVTHTLRGEGFDASEDGTGRGIPLVVGTLCSNKKAAGSATNQDAESGLLVPVYAIQERAVSENIANGPGGKGYQERIAYTLEARHHVQAVAYRVGGDGDVWESGDRVAALTTGTDPNSHIVMAHGQGGAEVVAGKSPTLSCNHEAPIVFSCKDYGADAGSISPTLRAMGHDGSHANAGGQVAVAFSQNQRGELRTSDVMPAMSIGGGKPGQGYPAVMTQRAVRRLTPKECERLQGFPDDYTLVTHRGKPAADGPRYKAIGNSIAIPVLRWIGERILMVDGISINNK